MFHKPSEPQKASFSDTTRARPLSSESAGGTTTAASPAAAAASSSSAAPVSPQQVTTTTTEAAAVASTSSTPTTNDNGSRLDGRQQQQPSQSRQATAGKMSYSVNKQQLAATALHQHYLNYFNSNIPKEEAKSQRTRGSISNSLSQTRQLQQQQQQQLQQALFPNHHHQDIHQPHQQPHPADLSQQHQQSAQLHQTQNQRINNHPQQNLHNHNQPSGNSNLSQIYHIPASNHQPPNSQHHHHYASPASNMSRSVPRDDNLMSYRMSQQQQQQQQQMVMMNPVLNHRTYSTGAIASSQPPQQFQSHQAGPQHQGQQLAPAKTLVRSTRQSQLDKDSSEEKATAIKGELENDLEGYKNSELEAISSLERNLPIELSFLIRQQAHCMARMNYLDRQLRELRESAAHLQQQQVDAHQVTSTSMMNNGRHANMGMTANTTHGKNGNFILSDDSGGEYSRATISDDDELSSLLDQIAKSVRPDQPPQQQQRLMPSNADVMLSGQMHTLQQQQQQRLTANFSTHFMGNQPLPLSHLQHQQQQQQQPQSYAIINPSQLQHQQAVPIFVMSSPIAVAHPSSINSNILPGVHFQPEPRYNQYYEDFYHCGNQVGPPQAPPSAPTMQRATGNGSFKSQQFDTSMSAVEQLVSQREKRQIISQLKSADNWLKMRASNASQEGSVRSGPNGVKAQTISSSSQSDSSGGQVASGDMRTASSSTIKQESDSRVMEENADVQ